MERSAMPSRTAPLRRGKALTRTALPPGKPLPAGTSLRRTPLVTARRDTGPTRATRVLVYGRCGATGDWPGTCEWPGCTRPRREVHHRLNRKAGGRGGAQAVRLNGCAWLLGVCRVHHRRVTSATGAVLAEVRAAGWVLTEEQDAAATPVWTRHQAAPVLLDATGGWVSALTD